MVQSIIGTDYTGIARDNRDCARVRHHAKARLHIWTGIVRPAKAALDNVLRVKSIAGAVESVEHERSFVAVTIPGQDQVHTVVFEHGQNVFPRFNHLELDGVIRAVRALAVRRVVKICNQPLIRVRGNVLPHPGKHRSCGRTVLDSRFKAKEMNVCIIK